MPSRPQQSAVNNQKNADDAIKRLVANVEKELNTAVEANLARIKKTERSVAALQAQLDEHKQDQAANLKKTQTKVADDIAVITQAVAAGQQKTDAVLAASNKQIAVLQNFQVTGCSGTRRLATVE